MKLRNCEIVINKDCLKVNIQECIDSLKTIKEYAYILHDKDKYIDAAQIPPTAKVGDHKKAHYHIYLGFSCAWDTKNIANKFGCLENCINKIKGNKRDMLLYLTHSNAKEKHQYSKSEVFTNMDLDFETSKGMILNYDFDNFSYQYYENEINNILDTKTKVKNYDFLRKCWELYIDNLPNSLGWSRDMKVIYISGGTGCGKTTYAKIYAREKLGFNETELFISGSSNDALDGYKGQKCIILDDLRASSYTFSDLLKFLDKNTATRVKSRFYNKDTRRCEYVIITSCYDIDKLYQNENLTENRNQLYRRCEIWLRNIDKTYKYQLLQYDNHLRDYVLTEKVIDITARILDLQNKASNIDLEQFDI